jgi:hypothetical protein
VGSRLRRSRPARRTPMQPAQLSLFPDLFPPPPQILLAQLPEPEVAEAIRLLAHLIAAACLEAEAADDE